MAGGRHRSSAGALSAVIARPLSGWPGARTPPHKQRRAAFRAKWSDTVQLLEAELDAIGARDVVLELDITDRDISASGWVRATAVPRTAGAILSFRHPQAGPLRYPCDRFNDWQDNVRAIALGLEALRKLDRYGITSHAEQYTGWRALPSSNGQWSPTPAAAARFLADFTEGDSVSDEFRAGVARSILERQDVFRLARAAALKKAHPDAGGSATTFHAVTDAIAALESKFR